MLGGLDSAPLPLWLAAWLTLWVLYTSMVNVGQRFYGFGWESMLLEAGFFVTFLGPPWMQPCWIPILALRWMLFRVELGAGLIKLRHDPCWRNLTCLDFHYETQPVPNPWSWHFHHLPRWFHRLSVLISHGVQVVMPFLLLLPQPWASLAGASMIAHQMVLIVSGNYSWLNWLTVVIAASAFGPSYGSGLPRPLWFDVILLGLAILTLICSKQPLENLWSKNQKMNYCYNPWRLVNSYGAFGSVGRKRYELEVQGTLMAFPEGDEDWLAYEFWGKPGDPRRRPLHFAPFHLYLDWLMWFLPLHLGPELKQGGNPQRRLSWRYETWFITFLHKLLQGDRATVGLLRSNPFQARPPLFVRVLVYEYRYSTPAERQATGAWWVRQRVGVYLPAYGGRK